MIVLIRHGQTTTNADGLVIGRSDVHLTELGQRQARALGPYLVDVAQVWVSPLARARETAALALAGHPALVKESFIEVDYGELEGQRVSALTPEHWQTFEHGHELAFGGAESLADVDARVHAELDALLADSASLLHDPRHHLAIVSHVSPIKSATIWALGAGPSVLWRTRLDNGSITTIGVRRSTPVLVRFNQVPLLDD